MGQLVNPDPKRTKPMGGKRVAVPAEPPPAEHRYTADGVWRPNAPGFADRPGEPDTRPLPKRTRRTR
jgi:hypothetical protein